MSEKAKITGLKVSNFKRVKLIEIQPEQNGLTILGGKNRQGKSSVLDAISYALGGESFRPSTVNNTEADESATIRVEIDGLIVERKGKNADLKITDARGMKGNQTLLNELVSKFALDLGTFLNASETDKAKMLLQMFPELESALAELSTQANVLREERADINRDMKRLQTQINGMAIIQNIPDEEIKIEELTARLSEVSKAAGLIDEWRQSLVRKKQDGESMTHRLSELAKTEADIHNEILGLDEAERAEIKKLEDEFQRRETEIHERFSKRKIDAETLRDRTRSIGNETKEELSVIHEKIAELEKSISEAPDCETQKNEILSKLQSANETNAQIRQNTEYRHVESEVKKSQAESESRTKQLDEIDAQRAELLKHANLPLPELAMDEESKLLFNGQKWDCMSGAEKLKVATAICMGTKPGCGFVLIDGLEAMDADTLAEFSEFLAEKEMQGIGTIVGDEQATVVIEDGMIKETEA